MHTESLSTVCDLVVDCPHFTPEWTTTGFLVIRNENIRNGRMNLSSPSYTHRRDFDLRNKRATPTAGDIIFTREAPMGEVCLVPEGLQCCVGQRQVLLRPSQGIQPRYLLYAMMSPFVQHQILWNEGTGSTVSNVRIPVLKALKIPRLGSQTEALTASLLGALDDKIDLIRRKNETLEAMARALFKDWFVDFGPVRAKMEGCEPYLAPEVWEMFPEGFGDEEIPDGWSTCTLADLAPLSSEAWGSRDTPAEIEYVDLANTKWGVIEQTQMFLWTDAPSRARRVLRPGDTIVGTVRPGNGSYALVGIEGLTGSTGFAVLRPKHPYLRELTYLAATDPATIETLNHLADGAAYPAVRPDVVAAQPVALSPDRIQRAFSHATSSLIDRVETNRLQSRTLAALRDALLPKLLSGEIRVRDAKRMVEAAV